MMPKSESLGNIQIQDQPHKAKHAPIALTLLDCFSMAITKALKTQKDDASPNGILNFFLSHTMKA
jgi:hypothetical protein